MGRPRTFDVDEALERAVEVFWTHGYTGTSWRQVCDAMAIGSGSSHAAYGSKARLFCLALERYVATQRAALGRPEPDAIRRWFGIVAAERSPRGCLLVVSALERDALPPDGGAIVSAALAGIESFFWRSLGAGAGARQDAAALAATLAGIHVLHRAGAGPAELRPIADRALGWVGLGPSIDPGMRSIPDPSPSSVQAPHGSDTVPE